MPYPGFPRVEAAGEAAVVDVESSHVEAAPGLARLQPELDSHQCEGEIRAVVEPLRPRGP